MGGFLHDLNNMSGALLAIIAITLSSCAKSLYDIHRTLACLHHDFEQVNHAHDQPTII